MRRPRSVYEKSSGISSDPTGMKRDPVARSSKDMVIRPTGVMRYPVGVVLKVNKNPWFRICLEVQDWTLEK